MLIEFGDYYKKASKSKYMWVVPCPCPVSPLLQETVQGSGRRRRSEVFNRSMHARFLLMAVFKKLWRV